MDWYDFEARNYDASLGRWMNLDPLAEKYYDWSPYNYVKNSSTTMVDPDGMDVILFIWLTSEGSYGHAGIAVSNYKKDKDGNYEKDEDGNQIEDGTYTYYDLYPDEPVDRLSAWGSQDPDFKKGSGRQGQIRTAEELEFGVQSDLQIRPADGILLTETDFASDQAVKERLEAKTKDGTRFDSRKYNCSNFCREAYEGILYSQSNAPPPIFEGDQNYSQLLPTMFGKEKVEVSGRKFTLATPHQLFKDVKKFQTTYIITDLGKAVNKSSSDSFKGN